MQIKDQLNQLLLQMNFRNNYLKTPAGTWCGWIGKMLLNKTFVWIFAKVWHILLDYCYWIMLLAFPIFFSHIKNIYCNVYKQKKKSKSVTSIYC